MPNFKNNSSSMRGIFGTEDGEDSASKPMYKGLLPNLAGNTRGKFVEV